MLHYDRRPLEWSVYEPGKDDRAVRVLFFQSGTAAGPNFPVAEVQLAESEDTVAITLYEHAFGEVELLARVSGCIEVMLDEPLGTRKLIDGSNGREARRLDRSAREGQDDWFLRSELDDRCPRWSR
jgi:hypothetical protein